MKDNGIFITFEGADGAGKSVQCQLLASAMKKSDISYVLVREPGGTLIGEQIRKILIDRSSANMTEKAELLLYLASRAQLTFEVIKPALRQGKVVISDRFADSSVVYQGVVRHIGVSIVEELNAFATSNLEPDITFLLDEKPQVFYRRLNKKRLDRLESEGSQFIEKVVNAYRNLANQNTHRFVILDASLPVNDIHNMIVDTLKKRFLRLKELKDIKGHD